MATRYWVGGTGTWDTSSTTNWSLTSGGSSGASAPTSADDVIIDTSSGTGTISCTGALCRDLTVTASQAITLRTSSGIQTYSVFGNLTFPSGGSFSASSSTSTMIFASTTIGNTITTNGKSLSQVVFNGVGGEWTLGSDFTSSTITLTNGTLNTSSANNYALNASTIALGAGTKALNLNASTVTITAAGGGAFNFNANVAGFTFNAGTSQINLSGAGVLLQGGGLTYNNVSFTSTSVSNSAIIDVNTFNNLTLTPPTGNTGYVNLVIYADQTINGTFTCSGNSVTNRTFVRSDSLGIARTLTAATVATLSDVNFRDISFSASQTGTRLGDCGGNTNITFDAGKTVYWNLAGSQSFAATGWATTNNGTPAVNNYPLPQDTAVFTDSGAAGTITCGDAVGGTLPQIDLSARTSTMTLDFYASAGQEIYGGFINSANAAVTLAWFGNGSLSFRRRSAVTFNTANRTFPGAAIIGAPGGTVSLGDNTILNGSLILSSGTLDGNTYNVTCNALLSSTSNTRTLTLGNGLWTLTGTGTVLNFISTGITLNKGTSDILLSNTSATTRTIIAGGLTFNKITIGGTTGTSTTNFSTGGGTFSEIASTKTVAHTISFSPGTFTFTTWSVTGTAGNLVTLISTATGTQRTVTVTNKTSGIDYLDVRDINGVNIAPYTFFVGANSVNSGNNIGVAFIEGAANNAYLLTSGTTFTVPANWNSSSNSIYMIGGGGGGSGNSISSTTSNRIGGAGGGGAGYLGLTNQTLTPSSTVLYSIGAGGAGGGGATASGTSTGGAGGATYWGGTQNTITNLTPTKQQNTSSSTTITINVPTGTVAGDVMVAFLTNASSGTFNTLTGWTLGATATGRGIFYKIAGHNEPASYTFVASTSGLLQGYIVTYENAVWGGVSAASSNTSPTQAPSVTTTSTNSMVVAFYSSTLASITYSTPTSYTTLDSNSDTTAPSNALFYRVYAAAGATGIVISTPSSGLSIGYQVFLSPTITYTSVASGGLGGVSTAGLTTTGGVGGAATDTLPSFVNSTISSTTTPSASPVTINVPSGTANGDLMVMFIQVSVSATFTTPSGWTVAPGTPTSGEGIFYRTASSEPASYAVTFSSGTAIGTISTFRNVEWDTNGILGAASTTPTASAITVSQSGGMLLWLARNNGVSISFTLPANYIEIDAFENNANVNLIIGYRTPTSAGSTGTVAGVSSSNSRALLISLKPTNTGNTGGSGGGSTASTTTGACGGGGGGGAAGPNGIGGNGGIGSTGGAVANAAAGGGGGNGGGSAGGNAVTNTSGAGGNNSLGSGGGASVTASTGLTGTRGGGGSGGGGGTFAGGSGSAGIDILNTVGSGGGSGGSIALSNTTPNPGLYGGGAGGAGGPTTNNTFTGDTGTQGMIFIIYFSGNAFTDSITENSSLADVLETFSQFSVNQLENVNMADTQAATCAFAVNITEDTTLNDLLVTGLVFADSIVENTIVEDINSARIDYNLVSFENVGLLDAAITNGWFKIDTNQPSTWNSINNTQSSVWNTVNSSQVGSWNNVDNTSGTTWDPINNNNSAPWDPINNSQ